MSQSNARYHSIILEPDAMSQPGTYRLRFSTTPGMSTAIGDLRMGDLDALAGLLEDRTEAAQGPLVAAPRRPASGEPCAHCGGADSGCHCDIEYA